MYTSDERTIACQTPHTDCDGPMVAMALNLRGDAMRTRFYLDMTADQGRQSDDYMVAMTHFYAFETSLVHAGPPSECPPEVREFPHVSTDRLFVFFGAPGITHPKSWQANAKAHGLPSHTYMVDI